MATVPTKRPVSAVWDYFTVVHGREEVATCNICNAVIRRGAAGASSKSFSTKALWGHMKAKHKYEHCLAEEKQAEDLQKKGKKRKMQDNIAQGYVQQENPSSFSTSKQLTLVELLDVGMQWDSKQLTFMESLDVGKQWNSKQPEQIEGEKLLTYWLCDGLKSYETVENAQFQRFVSHLSKKFKVPSEKMIRTKHVPELNEKVQYVVMQSLKSNSSENGSYSITTDIWSSPSKDSFMSIAAHWITKDFKRKLAVLKCIHYNTAHTASNLPLSVNSVCTDWGLNNVHVIVTDSASDNILAVKNAGYQSIGCFCHTLHLVVQHSVLEQPGVKLMTNRVRTLVKKLRRPKMKAIFTKYQKQAGVPMNSMVLDCQTRRGSVYTMLERVLQQKQAIKLAENDPDLNIVAESKMTPNDWDLIPKALALLGPINAASKAAEGDTASLSDIIPLTKKLKFEVTQVSQAGIAAMKETLLNQIHRYLEGGDSRAQFVNVEQNPLTVVATLLDPRYKTAAFQNKDYCRKGKEALLSLVISELSRAVSEAEPTETDTAEPAQNIKFEEACTTSSMSSSWDIVLNDDSDSSREGSGLCPNVAEAATTELNKYLKMKRIDVSDDPLTFWAAHNSELPTLSSLARTYLGSPLSSTIERQFEIGKMLQKDRVKSLPKNVETLLFLKCNLRAVAYTTSLPTVPKGFIAPNSIEYDVGIDTDTDSDHSSDM